MSVASPTRTPLQFLVLAVALGVIFTLLRNRDTASPPDSEAQPEYCRGLSEEACRSLGFQALEGDDQAKTAPEGGVLSATEACVGAGYLCADVERTGELRVMRWPEETGSLRVWIPAPDQLSPASAAEFQRAATRGIQVWHNHPLPLSISTRRVRDDPEITVRWVASLGGNTLGRARMEWRMTGDQVEVSIPGLTLVTHHPNAPEVELSPDEVRLVAAHEMGHALGLPHSDDPRDLMYPQNTAWRPTARDYRTMEALYRLPNGALIRR